MLPPALASLQHNLAAQQIQGLDAGGAFVQRTNARVAHVLSAPPRQPDVPRSWDEDRTNIRETNRRQPFAPSYLFHTPLPDKTMAAKALQPNVGSFTPQLRDKP